MSFNEDIAAQLGQIAKLLELTGANRFRVNAHTKAARVIEALTSDLEPIAEDLAALVKIDGVGKGIAEKISEYGSTGSIAELDELLAEVPAGLLKVLEIPGLGPKTVQALWKDLGVTDLAGLERVLDSGEILCLPRMGEKAAAKIRESLRFAESAGARLHLGLAWPAAEAVVERVRAVAGVRRAAYAGSLRRGRDTIGDIDILAVADDPAAVHAAFTGHESVVQVIGSGETKSSVRARIDTGTGRFRGVLGDEATVQIDLRVVPEESWGAALMYFTGSKDHNVALRERAQSRGLTLNEYGLFPADDSADENTPPQKRGVPPVASATEEEVFAALDLPWIPPEIREDLGELAGDPPKLIEVGDIKCELHAHTTESDGRMPLEELVRRASERGYHTIAVTDHSRSSVQANGLSVERLREQRSQIEALRRDLGDETAILCGSEVDILTDGSLDYDEDILDWLDIVVASPHAALTQDPKTATARLIRAIESGKINVLGHPTGRIIARRPGLAPAMDEIYAAAREHSVALEINSHWLRLDLRDTHVRGALEAGCLIAINCDTHAADDLANTRFGVATGRRGGLTASSCVNTWDRPELLEWLGTDAGIRS